MSEPAFVASTRRAYDTVAVDYERLLRDALDASPLDRALLGVWAEQVAAAGGGPVVDLGCGPGRLTGHLRSLGLDVSGLDLSPGMVAVARRTCPGTAFVVGSLLALPYADGALAGALAWYSVIHTPPDRLPEVVRELVRVVRPGGPLLLAFQAGSGQPHRGERPYGHDVSLTSYRHDAERVGALLAEAGAPVSTRVLREPEGFETTRQAFLLAWRGPAIIRRG